MTTFREETRTCYVCGSSGRYNILTSTNTMGPSDLDTRPAEMARSTIGMWIQHCPACGYCAPDVSQDPPQALQIVKSDAYLRQSEAPEYPALANHFLCWAIIQEGTSGYAEAGWAATHAAWAYDDAQDSDAATKCRRKAVELFRRARVQGVPFHQETGAEEALLADLLRRSGMFAQVPGICQVGLAKDPTDIVRRVLLFEDKLARARDRKCHTVAEL